MISTLNAFYSGGHVKISCFMAGFFAVPAHVNVCTAHSLRHVQNPMKSGSCVHTVAGESNVVQSLPTIYVC